ncbi:hypothetical protein Mgra_00006869 [Meloidogyne graminicola]|uniref:DUF7773 domain-containing protein n=1 Tax=Meloidogyne graminicola TaxID=189291 RepID=A0A8S9ZK08_9BILA|nr:hypothetical protein Mgra_00006869 [Meloidogyne graminicola]
MFYLILFNYHLLIIQLLINFIFCLNCFDSQSPIPIKVTKCKEEEVCYVEYYSLKTEQNLKELVHYFDRFCVNKRHCTDRGIWPEYKSCINLTQLDKMVAKTFERKLRSERLDPSKIVFTYFCCCSDYDKCNELGPNKLRLLFNLSISEEKYSQTIYFKTIRK